MPLLCLRKTFFCFALSILSFACAAQQQTPRTAFVHLFEWPWLDIAEECETVLGPKGFAAVQISPPQKSDPGPEWWRRYQPVSYEITGRSGNRAQFKEMVDRCAAVGVDIYADLVINHMAAYNRNFPEVPYNSNDFHFDYCAAKGGMDYSIRRDVQFCDLLGLNDLKSESQEVRQKIANYINDLSSLGVKGFRVDAAKHMPAEDIREILRLVNGNPYVFQEVIGAPNEPIKPSEYVGNGDVTEFAYSKTVGWFFKNGRNLGELFNIGRWQGWLSSSDAVVFVSNHDEQRFEADKVVTFKDAAGLNDIAEIFMLAYPYGYPKVMSSYKFNTFDQGPPTSGPYGGDSCFDGGWVCEHRWRGIMNMVAFRNATASEFRVTNSWVSQDTTQLAFGRGGKGFVVINRNSNATLSNTFNTGMPAGVYCDVIAGNYNVSDKTCDGPTISVDGNGRASFSVPKINASAIHVNAVVEPICETGCECQSDCETGWKNAFFRGTPNTWGLTPMERVEGLWETVQYFEANGNPRFKISRFPDWREAVPAQDVLITDGPGFYRITLDDRADDLPITVNKLQNSDVDVTFTCNGGNTRWGQSVFVVGDLDALGNWDPSQAIRLSAANYPTWSGTISLPDLTPFEWKCIKRNNNNNGNLVWQRGENNSGYSSEGLVTEGNF